MKNRKHLLLLLIFPVLAFVLIAIRTMCPSPICRQSVCIDTDAIRDIERSCRVFTPGTTSFRDGKRVRDQYLFAESKKVGDSASFMFQVETLGKFQVEIFLPKASSYGIVDIWINDDLVGHSIDLFSSETERSVPFNIGAHDLKSENTLRIEVIGSNSFSSEPHYQWAVDKIRLTKPLGLFEKITSGQLFSEVVVSDELSSEDVSFLQRVVGESLGSTDVVQKKELTQKILQLLNKTTSSKWQGKIYYTAGELNYYGKNYHAALFLMRKATEIYPELYGNPRESPAPSHIAFSVRQRSLEIIKRLVKISLMLLILITMIFYFVTKPWQWVSVKHLVSVFVLIFGALFMFLLIKHFTSNMVRPGTEYFLSPIFSNDQLEGFGHGISMTILRFYIVGISGIIIAMVPLSRVRFKFTKVVLSLLIAFIVFFGTMSLFCFRQTESIQHFSRMSFLSNKKSVIPYLMGNWYWSAKDFKPYVISDPRKFAGLNFDLSNEPVFKDWLKDKYSKINSLSDNDEIKSK